MDNSNVDWIARTVLVAVRIGPLFLLTPVFGSADLPARFRVLLVLALAATFALAAPGPAMEGLARIDRFVPAALADAALGAAMAFGLLATFAAFQFGGRLIDIQIGFGVGNLFDPITRTQGPLLGTALNLMAVSVFFGMNGHHLVLRAIAWSLERFPPGQSVAAIDPQVLIDQFGVVFVWGLAIVAPVAFSLLMIDAAGSVMARTMPQMNIFVVAMPLKAFVGLAVLALSLRFAPPAMEALFGGLGRYWQRLLP